MREIGVNTWVWTSPLTDAGVPDLLRRIAGMGFDAVELPLENAGDLTVAVVRRRARRDRPDALRRRGDGTGPRPGGRRLRAPPPRTTSAPASTSPPASGRPRCAARSTPPPAGSGGWTPTSGRRRTPTCGRTSRRWSTTPSRAAYAWGSSRSTATRPPSSTPSTRPSTALGPLLGDRAGPGPRHLPPQHRGALQRRRDPHRGPAPGARPGLRQRPGRAGRRPDRLAGPRGRARRGRLRRPARTSRASPPTTPPSPPPPRSGVRWRRPRTTWPATGWPSCGPSPDFSRSFHDHPTGPAAPPRCRRHRLRLHGQGALPRVAQRRGPAPRRPGRTPAGAGRPRRRRRRRAAGQFGWAESATDWRAVIERDDIDIVDVCVPGHLHAEVAIAALEAGKHVHRREAAGQHPRRGREDGRHRPGRPRARRALDGGLQLPPGAGAGAGPPSTSPTAASATYARCASPTSRTGWPTRRAPMTWRLRRETAGSGALGDLASHAVDQVRFLLGQEVTGLNARTETFVRRRTGADGPEDVTVDDAAWSTMRTSGGAVVSLEVSRMASGRKNALGIEVYGSRGCPALRPGVAQPPRRLPRRRRQLLAGARHRAGRPLPRRLVARGTHAGLGRYVHQPGRRLPLRAGRGAGADAVVRGRARRAAGAGRDRGQRRAGRGDTCPSDRGGEQI